MRDHLAWPGQMTMARLSGASDRGVRKALSALLARGEIKIVTPGQGRRSTVYRVEILDEKYEVLEPAETGTPVPICGSRKPELSDRQTGTPVPIEEEQKETPSFSPSLTAGEDSANAEKQNGSGSAVFLSNIPNLSSSAVDEIHGDRARESEPPGLAEHVAELQARFSEQGERS